MPNNWIQKANLKVGTFTAQANRAGYTNVQEYAKFVLEPENKSSTREITKKRARLAISFSKMKH